jgi:3-hydroxyacyl-CoA dehydrogenase
MADVEKRMALLTPRSVLDALAERRSRSSRRFSRSMAIKKAGLRASSTTRRSLARILATNTSYLDVDEIASATKRPGGRDRHAFLLARQRHASAGGGARRQDGEGRHCRPPCNWAKEIGKIAVARRACAHGFVGNRMLAQRQREAQKLILEGAMPSDIDRVLYDFGLADGSLRR